MDQFKLVSEFHPSGDQPAAVESITHNLVNQVRHQVLLGVTGSGKTFTMANVICRLNRPTLVISHNKTLAAQLYAEFKLVFPYNAVEYFISYYDYYQPEAYIPQTDTYIDKDASINDHIDRLRLKATASLLSRRDVVVVSSVSCIYNIGSPEDYRTACLFLSTGQQKNRDLFLQEMVEIQYERNDISFTRGKFRVRGDTVEVFPAYLEIAYRIELFGNEIEKISEIDPLTGNTISVLPEIYLYPAKYFITPRPRLEQAVREIEKELDERVDEFTRQGKLLEAERIRMRTKFDLEMIQETGTCHGIENYSRHLSARPPGARPACLLDFFPPDFLLIIDESHVTLPQVRGMYEGDHSRKHTLVEYGFRLPSALDNRPLKFTEFENLINQVVYVTATPAPYELDKAKGLIIEQVIRPTGLVDPEVIVRRTEGQVEDLIREITVRVNRRERVLVTTLTKRMAEDLSEYLISQNLRVRYLHSEIDALARIEILKDLRKGTFDCLVGVNLLREGLDLPEVSLVAVLDADKEGFLRSETSLIQVCGRAARNIHGQVILYADTITGSMQRAMQEMSRRRNKQIEHNQQFSITPQSIVKAVQELTEFKYQLHERSVSMLRDRGVEYAEKKNIPQLISELKREMETAAENLDFELAALIRDKLIELNALPIRQQK